MTLKQKTILAVDDDEDILKFLKKILEAAGFTVLTAPSADEGRELLARELPHLIISDLNMEPENGYSFIKSVRKEKLYQHIPIVVLSAVNEFNIVKKVIALGISDYAIKPLQAPLLVGKIKKALFKKEMSTWTPAKGAEPVLTVRLEAEVVELGEAGYRLAGPFKLTPGKKLAVDAEEFRKLGLGDLIHQSSNLLKSSLRGGVFSNDVTFMAVNEAVASRIRQFVKKGGAS